jgi:hypothetical protein
MRDFKNANIPHFKAVARMPVNHLEDILNDKYAAEMLAKCFQVQAFYPTQVSTEVDHLMNTLWMHSDSEWISNNKKLSTEKTISKLLSITMKDILKYSHKVQRDNLSLLAYWIVYQNIITMASYQKAFENKGSDKNFKYYSLLRSDPWEQLIKDPFNKDRIKAYLCHTALE